MGQDPIGTSVDMFPCLAAFVSVVLALALRTGPVLSIEVRSPAPLAP
jgi:hypothetical protein